MFQDGSVFCSEVLPPASSRSPMCLLTCADGRLWRLRLRECIPGGKGVAGSNPAAPRRSKAGSGFQLPAFGCNGSARALPSVAPAKRSGVFCRPGILTSDYRHSARPRAGSRPSPPTRVSFSPGQGVADSDPAVKNWFWATAADGRASASGCHFVRLSPRRPTSSARAADAPCHRRWAARRSEDVPAFVELESGGPPPVACQVVGVGQLSSHPTKEGDRREQHLSEGPPPCPA